VGYSELQGPFHYEVIHIFVGDLVEFAVVPAFVIAVGHAPLTGVAQDFLHTVVGKRQSRQKQRSSCAERDRLGMPRGPFLLPVLLVSHSSNSFLRSDCLYSAEAAQVAGRISALPSFLDLLLGDW